MRERERAATLIADEATPSLDLIFDLLSNRRRRYALYTLYDQPDGVATVDELAAHVAALETRALADDDAESDLDSSFESPPTPASDADSPAATSSDQRTEIRTELQHVHLPKLEDAGILEHDLRSDTVRYWTQPSLEEWLEHAYHKEL